MFDDILWTPASEAHIARHQVEPHEVGEATERPFHTMPGREGTTLLLGRTYHGRYLLVVFASAYDGRAYVATARDMTDAERRVYTRKAR